METTRVPERIRRAPRPASLLAPALAAGLLAGWLGGCNSSGGSSGGQVGIVGNEGTNPDTGQLFIVDPNQGGSASRVRIANMFWGRLVDVHDIDAITGEPDPTPVFTDFVINQNIQTNGTEYVLETNPITQRTRLIIQRTKPDELNPEPPSEFEQLLTIAAQNLSPITPKHDDGSSSPPFSFISRNATLVVQLDDLMDDSDDAEAGLIQTVKVQTGYPPSVPFAPRMRFDPNHGGVVNGQFHSSRLLIDMTISETELATMAVPQPVNSLGLPPSLSTTSNPNVSVRIPSRVDFGSGQFEILRNLAGSPMATTGNGPIDFGAGGVPVVRAMRSGNELDTNNGFLLDLNAPEIVGGWPLTLDTISPDPTGDAGFDFVCDLTFSTICRAAPGVGDIVGLGQDFLEVTQPAGAPNPVTGKVASVRMRTLSEDPIANPSQLLGTGIFQSTYDPSVPVAAGCWISFAPQPVAAPASGVKTQSQIVVRFSEPMDPLSLQPFDTFIVVAADAASGPGTATSIVVGDVQASSDLKDFTYTPQLPFAHSIGVAEQFHVELIGGPDGVTDLAGNALANSLPFVDFTIDEAEPTVNNGGIVMRFDAVDEVDQFDPCPDGCNDLRGQFLYDLDRGIIKPRPTSRQSFEANRQNPVPQIMIPFPSGVQTPLSPLGSKLMSVWRYCDFGFQVSDETKFNLDIEGLNWAPVGGQIIADFYEEFEIRLAHSRKLPDEFIDGNLLPMYPNSGLGSAPVQYADNILVDPLSPQKVVHNRALGYQVSPTNLFLASSGTFMMPFPLNQSDGPVETYTWRDTRILKKGGPNGTGIPLDIEVFLGLEMTAGSVATANNVPSFGLPLLMEYRCYPSDSGVGLNAFDISLAINSSARPNFRAFSTGGVNTAGVQIIKDPDAELVPSGGFNPTSTPVPGAPTQQNADNTFYIGQIDTIIRQSIVHALWLDSGSASGTDYLPVVVEPKPDDQPTGTAAIIEFRGATGFAATANGQFNAETLDPYGNPTSGTTSFLGGNDTWSTNVDVADGARYIQMRITFLNNIQNGLSPELSAIGVAWENPMP